MNESVLKSLVCCWTCVGSNRPPSLGKGGRRRVRGACIERRSSRGRGRREGELKTADEITKQRRKKKRMKEHQQKKKRRQSSSARGGYRRTGRKS